MSPAVECPSRDDEIAVRRGDPRPADRTPLQSGAVDERAGGPRNPVGNDVAIGLRVLKDASCTRHIQRLRALSIRERFARRPPQRRRIAGFNAERRREQHFTGVLQTAAIVAKRHRRRRIIARRSVAARRGVPRRSDRQSAVRRSARCRTRRRPTVPGVPAHASRPAAPCMIVQRTRPLMVTAASARTLDGPSGCNRAAPRPNDEPANSRVGDEDVRTAAQERHRNAGRMRQPQRGDRFRRSSAARRTCSARSADAETSCKAPAEHPVRCVRRRTLPQAAVREIAHAAPSRSTAISACSCLISAAIACCSVHTSNWIRSPGAS